MEPEIVAAETEESFVDALSSCQDLTAVQQDMEQAVQSPFLFWTPEPASDQETSQEYSNNESQIFRKQQNLSKNHIGEGSQPMKSSRVHFYMSLREWIKQSEKAKTSTRKLGDPSYVTLQSGEAASFRVVNRSEELPRRSEKVEMIPRRCKSIGNNSAWSCLAWCKKNDVQFDSKATRGVPILEATAARKGIEVEVSCSSAGWSSKKTVFLDSDDLDDEPPQLSVSADSLTRSPSRTRSMERLYNKVFCRGSPESSTRISLSGVSSLLKPRSSFSSTTSGSEYMLSNFTFRTISQFNGIWKTCCGARKMEEALASFIKVARWGMTRGGVRYLLIDSTPSLFRTSTWTSLTQHREQRPWNGQTLTIGKVSGRYGEKQLSVKVNGPTIVAETKWTGKDRLNLTEEYTLSPDFRRLKITATMEKPDVDVLGHTMTPTKNAVRTFFVHNVYYRRCS